MKWFIGTLLVLNLFTALYGALKQKPETDIHAQDVNAAQLKLLPADWKPPQASAPLASVSPCLMVMVTPFLLVDLLQFVISCLHILCPNSVGFDKDVDRVWLSPHAGASASTTVLALGAPRIGQAHHRTRDTARRPLGHDVEGPIPGDASSATVLYGVGACHEQR